MNEREDATNYGSEADVPERTDAPESVDISLLT